MRIAIVAVGKIKQAGLRAELDDYLARIRRYAMTSPQFFAVDYAINPWMDTDNPVDTAVAVAQWEHLRDTYLRLGHVIDLVAPVPGRA